MYVEHTAIRVSDIDASRAFYVDGLGLTVQRTFEDDDGSGSVFVGDGTGGLLQLQYDPAGGPVDHAEGLDHFGVATDDVEAAFDRLVERTGCPVVREPSQGHSATVAFVEDPDGYTIELVER